MYTKNNINDNHAQTYNTNIFISSDQDMTEIKNWKEKLLSILEQVPADAERIKPMVQFIVAAIAPAKIYMMKHRETESTESENYLDLLIVISSKTNKPFVELQPILDMAYLNNWRISYSLHSEGSVIDGLQNGHIFYSLHCTPKNLIYDDKNITYPITSSGLLRKIKFLAYNLFQKNFIKALDFGESAEFINDLNKSQITVFLLHQAAELTFRGILQSLNGYDKKTHEINVLRKLARRCAPQLCNIFSENSPEEKRILDLLDSAYINARYENDFQIAEEDVMVIYEKLTNLLEMANKCVLTTLDIPEPENKKERDSEGIEFPKGEVRPLAE